MADEGVHNTITDQELNIETTWNNMIQANEDSNCQDCGKTSPDCLVSHFCLTCPLAPPGPSTPSQDLCTEPIGPPSPPWVVHIAAPHGGTAKFSVLVVLNTTVSHGYPKASSWSLTSTNLVSFSSHFWRRYWTYGTRKLATCDSWVGFSRHKTCRLAVYHSWKFNHLWTMLPKIVPLKISQHVDFLLPGQTIRVVWVKTCGTTRWSGPSFKFIMV